MEEDRATRHRWLGGENNYKLKYRPVRFNMKIRKD